MKTILNGQLEKIKLYKSRFLLFPEGSFTNLINETGPTFDKYGFMTSTLFLHHNYEQMEQFLFLYNKTYPSISRLHSIGKSVRGKELYVYVLSSTPERHTAGKKKIQVYVAVNLFCKHF